MQVRVAIRVPELLDPEFTDIGMAMAARKAFDEQERAGEPRVLEPIMRFEINTPEHYFGAINQDLAKRRAHVERVDILSGLRVLEGRVPLAEVFGYTTTLRSLSQGRATMSLEPVGYGPAPDDVAERFRF